MYLTGSKLILIFVNMNKKDLIDEVASKTDLTKKEIDTVLTCKDKILFYYSLKKNY